MDPYQQIAKKLGECTSLDELTEGLEHLLNGGYGVWKDGELYSIRQLVSRVNGLKIEIYSNEHSPPHFHVKGGDIDASFSIVDCALIAGKISGRERKLIEWWHSNGKQSLVNVWNSTRPTDCSVGPIK